MLRVLRRHLCPLSSSSSSSSSAPSFSTGASGAAAAAAAAPNAVVAENQLPGSDSSEWDVNGCGDPSIQGFATRMSVLPGETLELKVDTDAADYRVDIYRLGFYSGKGARKVDSVQPCVALPQVQPAPLTDTSTGLVDCDNWAVSARWRVPADAVSGVYLARLTRPEPSKGWRQDNTQTAGGAWMTGAPPGDGAAAGDPAEERLPSHDLDDEEQPVPNRPGWEHSYAANGMSGKLRNPIREPCASHVYFVVRAAAGREAAVLMQTNDTTWQAYNTYGGQCLYGTFGSKWCDDGASRSYVASYNRPLVTRDYRAINAPFGAEYPLLRFLERNGYDVAYQSGLDTHMRGVGSAGAALRLFVSVGHDEYWSGPQRSAVEAARDRGVNLVFFSGNEVYWRVRWEHTDGRLATTPQEIGSEEPRVMVCYKDSQATQQLDPVPGEWTGVWRDNRDINPFGGQPENALTGQVYVSDTWANFPLIVPPEHSRHRFWRHTPAANQPQGDLDADDDMDEGYQPGVVLLKGLIGHEFDEDIDNGYRPAGLARLSRTTIDNVVYLQDHAKVFDTGSATHALTLYRAQASGALVFGAGTCQWSWGLDPHHDSPAGVPPHVANPYVTRVGRDLSGPDKTVQQSTVNLFSDMGVLPATPLASLVIDGTVAAPVAGEHEPPTSEVVSTRIDEESGVLVATGVASVPGGAEATTTVAAVECSADGGISWHPANGYPYASTLTLTPTPD
jgi:hypothetical protein